MFKIMSLRHHWTKNFSFPALFMSRLLAITAFLGFVYVFTIVISGFGIVGFGHVISLLS
jgi:hypothetical protein